MFLCIYRRSISAKCQPIFMKFCRKLGIVMNNQMPIAITPKKSVSGFINKLIFRTIVFHIKIRGHFLMTNDNGYRHLLQCPYLFKCAKNLCVKFKFGGKWRSMDFFNVYHSGQLEFSVSIKALRLSLLLWGLGH